MTDLQFVLITLCIIIFGHAHLHSHKIAEHFEPNTVLWTFRTIQPSSYGVSCEKFIDDKPFCLLVTLLSMHLLWWSWHFGWQWRRYFGVRIRTCFGWYPHPQKYRPRPQLSNINHPRTSSSSIVSNVLCSVMD